MIISEGPRRWNPRRKFHRRMQRLQRARTSECPVAKGSTHAFDRRARRRSSRRFRTHPRLPPGDRVSAFKSQVRRGFIRSERDLGACKCEFCSSRLAPPRDGFTICPGVRRAALALHDIDRSGRKARGGDCGVIRGTDKARHLKGGRGRKPRRQLIRRLGFNEKEPIRIHFFFRLRNRLEHDLRIHRANRPPAPR